MFRDDRALGIHIDLPRGRLNYDVRNTWIVLWIVEQKLQRLARIDFLNACLLLYFSQYVDHFRRSVVVREPEQGNTSVLLPAGQQFLLYRVDNPGDDFQVSMFQDQLQLLR